MKSSTAKFKTVDDYINSFPPDVIKKLIAIRKIIKKEAPMAEESVAYDMAGYKLNAKPLIYFAAFKKHIGLYPGTTKVPLDEPVPTKLITDLVKEQVKRNGKKSTAKSKSK